MAHSFTQNLMALASNAGHIVVWLLPAAFGLTLYLFARPRKKKRRRSSYQRLNFDMTDPRPPPPLKTEANTKTEAPESNTPSLQLFIVEAMVSSGPRKSAADYASTLPELCEDAAGVIGLSSGRYGWWLCDGTGDGVFLPPVGDHPGLSTRQFARAMGDCFVSWIIAGGDSQSDIGHVIEVLRTRWYKRLNAYLQVAEDAGYLGKIHETFGGSNGNLSSPLKWSSTFIGGVVSPASGSGARLQIYQVGDSGGLVVQERELGVLHGTAILPASERIIALSTIVDTKCEVDMARLTRVEPQLFENVVGFSAMSDGVIYNENHKTLADFLLHLEQSVPRLSVDHLRAGLVGLRDRSFDDKSMIIGWADARSAH